MIFQDYLSRLTSSKVGTQAGNYFLESCMETKLLDLNIDKSCYIVVGNKKISRKIKSELEIFPLFLCGKKMKEKTCDKYLGDFIRSLGNSESAYHTISERYWRIVSCILEARTIIEDCRSSRGTWSWYRYLGIGANVVRAHTRCACKVGRSSH